MPTLDATDLERARGYFDLSRYRVTEATNGLTEEQWRFKPAQDRWSIAENLEHLVIVQERVMAIIGTQFAQGAAAPAGRDTARLDVIVMEKIPDRSIRAQAPAFIQPTGELNPAAALDRFVENQRRLLAMAESTPGLRERVLDAPPLRVVTNGEHTTMDGYQWLITVAAHDERHVGQIEELKADPNYPA